MLSCAKTKPCAHCGQPFLPFNSMATVCSPACAGRWVKAKRKTETATHRAQKKKSRETLPYLKRAAQKDFNAFIRERDKEQPCICCGRNADDKDLLTGSRWDAGHYRSTGSAPHLRFIEDNCHRQLVRCNRHGAGRAVDYRIGLIKRIGIARVEALEADNTPRHYTHDELRQIAAEYRGKLKALKASA